MFGLEEFMDWKDEFLKGCIVSMDKALEGCTVSRCIANASILMVKDRKGQNYWSHEAAHVTDMDNCAFLSCIHTYKR